MTSLSVAWYGDGRPGSRHLVGRDAGIRRLVSLHRRPSGRRCCFSPRPAAGRAAIGQTRAMPSVPTAELSSLASSVGELAQRVAELGEGLDQGGTSDVANALFEAERSLRMAERAIERARRGLGA